ncbi:MAG: hypothetical protein QOF78_3625 [Phycisphaerales bacterium]|jgi:hypothetical protein|nr:hypothetical protein [Phycisphaerales bacterium]
MTQILKTFNSLLDRVQRRFRRSRSGSVLILVVALLVLLALLGTAFITTTRIDRVSSVQHTKNVQIDLLVEGMVNLAFNAVRDDLYDTQALQMYRPTDLTPNAWTGYEHWDTLGGSAPVDMNSALPPVMPNDLWLASRYPRVSDPTFGASTTNFPFWDSVTFPMTPVTAGVLPLWQFDSPNSAVPFQFNFPYRVLPQPFPPGAQYFTMKPIFRPSFKEMPTGSGKFHPSLIPYHVVGMGGTGPQMQAGNEFLAADADGDGIADAGMWKLPVGHIDGVTYYAAIRIIDNNSAVNVNTAVSNLEFDGAYDSAGVMPRYYFPASVGLMETLRSYTPGSGSTVNGQSTEMGKLFEALCQGVLPKGGMAGGLKNGPAAADDGSPRGDFAYQSLGDLMYSQLGARIGNPGAIAPGASPALAQRMSINESIALAYHFVMLNRDATPSVMETTFASAYNPDSIYRGAENFKTPNIATPSYPATAAGLADWYDSNFRFDVEQGLPSSGFRPRRALLVAGNPVSNQAPQHAIENYATGAGMAGFLPNQYVPKTSINQASFPELWRAYWQVMSQQQTIGGAGGVTYAGSPFDFRVHEAAEDSPALVRAPTAAIPADMFTFNDPYLGSSFVDNTDLPYDPPGVRSYNPKDADKTNTVPTPTEYHPARMFRSSLRSAPDDALAWLPGRGFDFNTPRFNSAQMALLRSAIAAVNAEDMRDRDNDVTARRIVLQAAIENVNQAVDVVVYGNEPQPFITEVFAETDTIHDRDATGGATGGGSNPYGYVAIELYNPYPHDIYLTNWKIVAVDRRSTIDSPYNANRAGRAPIARGADIAPAYQIALDDTTLIADFALGAGADLPANFGTGPALVPPDPIVVPARGYLFIENYDGAVGAVAPVGHRPPATALTPTGPLPGVLPANTPGAAPGQVNYLTVVGLSGMVGGLADPAWVANPEWPSEGARSVFNREMVLLRPRRADGQVSLGIYPVPVGAPGAPLPYNETPAPGRRHMRDFVPVDSFDFTGLQMPSNSGATTLSPLRRIDMLATAWHYMRQNAEPGAAPGAPPNWKFVYPGRYDGAKSHALNPLGPGPLPRQQGTDFSVMWSNDPTGPPLVIPWDGGAPHGGVNMAAGASANIGSSYPRCTFAVQLVPEYNGALNPPAPPPPWKRPQAGAGATPVGDPAIAPNQYPFGGFARKGDILQVPFIGAYRVTVQAPAALFSVTEMNSVTMDAVFAEDTDMFDDPNAPDVLAVDTAESEQIGRFAPVRVRAGGPPAYAAGNSDYHPSTLYPNINDDNPAAGFAADPAGPLWVNDYGFDPSCRPMPTPSTPGAQFGADWEPYWRYRWAMDLFDYLDIRSPATDTQPNYPVGNPYEPDRLYWIGDQVSRLDPVSKEHRIYTVTANAYSTAFNTPAGQFIPTAVFGQAVKNTGDVPAAFPDHPTDAQVENNVASEGLININTANWRALATLPLVVQPPAAGPDAGRVDNIGPTFRNDNLAKAIVYFRDVDCDPNPNVVAPHGPFRSIFELNKVIDLRPTAPAATPPGYPPGTLYGFQNGYGTLPLSTVAGVVGPDDAYGDLSPINTTVPPPAALTDGVRGDYEERFLQLTRISNLITTRSDSFTCYILVQGWRDAETNNASLVVQRRVGYILDRSRFTPATPAPPNDKVQFLNN